MAKGGGSVTPIPQDVQDALRASLANYFEADLAFHQLMQELVETGEPLSTSQRAEVEELRQRRDYLLHVRMRDLRNIGWPSPNEVGRRRVASTGRPARPPRDPSPLRAPGAPDPLTPDCRGIPAV